MAFTFYFYSKLYCWDCNYIFTCPYTTSVLFIPSGKSHPADIIVVSFEYTISIPESNDARSNIGPYMDLFYMFFPFTYSCSLIYCRRFHYHLMMLITNSCFVSLRNNAGNVGCGGVQFYLWKITKIAISLSINKPTCKLQLLYWKTGLVLLPSLLSTVHHVPIRLNKWNIFDVFSLKMYII